MPLEIAIMFDPLPEVAPWKGRSPIDGMIKSCYNFSHLERYCFFSG
jgi:hypothetical protein